MDDLKCSYRFQSHWQLCGKWKALESDFVYQKWEIILLLIRETYSYIVTH